jgi:hypothetical protein
VNGSTGVLPAAPCALPDAKKRYRKTRLPKGQVLLLLLKREISQSQHPLHEARQNLGGTMETYALERIK